MNRYRSIIFWTSPSIRINRLEFSIKYLIYTLLMFVTGKPFGVFTKDFETQFGLHGYFILILPLSFLVLALITIKQRMNDLNFIKWYHFLLFFIAYVFVLILFFKKGSDEINVFGSKA